MDKWFFKFRFLGIGVFLAMLAVFAAVAMLLWNALMPELFGLPSLNYVQAAGMVALARILFGGLGGLGGGRFMPHGGHGRDERLFHHGNALREKWMNMSEEERKAFVEKERGFRNYFHDRFSHPHDSFDGRRGRCGGGAPAEGGSARPPEAGWSEGSDCETIRDFPPHKEGGNE